MPFRLLLFCWFAVFTTFAQKPIPVADQTFRMDGKSEYIFAFAEGDEVQLFVQELSGKEIKSIEFWQYPDQLVYRAYQLDSVLHKTLNIATSGVYLLRFQETGMSKKSAASPCTAYLPPKPPNGSIPTFPGM